MAGGIKEMQNCILQDGAEGSGKGVPPSPCPQNTPGHRRSSNISVRIIWEVLGGTFLARARAQAGSSPSTPTAGGGYAGGGYAPKAIKPLTPH